MSTPEDRLDWLEAKQQEDEHLVDGRLRALGTAIGQVHGDVLRLRAEVKDGFQAVDARFDRIERLLEERLPPRTE